MNLSITLDNGIPYFVIKYSEEEWQLIRKKWEELGLPLFTSTNLWGKRIKGQAYRLEATKTKEIYPFKQKNEKLPKVINDLNQPFLDENGTLNLAIFRVVPDKDGKVSAPIDKFLSLYQLKKYITILGEFLQEFLSIVVEREITFTFKKEEEKDKN